MLANISEYKYYIGIWGTAADLFYIFLCISKKIETATCTPQVQAVALCQCFSWCA